MTEVKVKSENFSMEFRRQVESNSEKFISAEDSKIAAKRLVSDHDLDMYFKPRANVSFCNHAVAVVAAVAAVVAAASSAIAASTRGRTIDTLSPLDLQEGQLSGMDVQQLMEIRQNRL